MKKEIKNIFAILIASVFGAFGMHIFVYPNYFAPAGVDGIATMLQEITSINAGIFTLLFNIPLFIIAWAMLKRRYVIYTIVFTVITSGLLMLLERVEFYQYYAETDRLIAALFSGIMLGVRTSIMIKMGGSTGGADIIACAVQTKRAYGNVERIISIICYCIVAVSYFLYRDLNCILLSIVQLIVFEWVMKSILSPTRNAIEAKIITDSPDDIVNELLFNLKHGATVVEGKGMFTQNGNSVVFSVINIRQIPEFMAMIKKYPNTFVYYSDVRGVNGNFRWRKEDIAK